MIKIRLKTLLLSITVLSLFATIIFWQQTLSFLVAYSFKSYCKECLQSDLKAERIDKNEWTIAYVKPQLVGLDGAEHEAVHLDAKELVLRFEPRLLEREIDLYITLVDPRIDFKKMAPALYSLLSRARTDWGILKINHKVQIDNGLMVSGGQAIRFTVDHDFITANHMQLKANFGQSDGQNSIVMNMYESAPKQVEVDIECNNLCCRSLSMTLESLFPALQHWKVGHGILNGDFSVKFVKHQEPLIASKFDLQDFGLNLEPFGIQVVAPNVHVDYDYSRTSFIQLRDPASLKFVKSDKTHVLFEELLGKIVVSKNGIANLDAEGTCTHHDEQFSARFSGEKHGQEMSLGLRMDSQDRKEIAVNLASRGSDVEIEVKNFSPNEFDVIQNFFGEYSTNVHAVKMRSGTLNAVLLTPLESSKIQKLRLMSLSGQQLKLDYSPWGIAFDADHITGKFGVDLFADNFLKSLDAQVAITNGLVHPLDEGFDCPIFSNIHTNLTIEKGVVRDSVVNGKFVGMEGKMWIDWTAPHDLMSFSFSGAAEDIFAMAPKKLREKFEEKFKHDDLAIHAHVTRSKGIKSVVGDLCFSTEASDRKDLITFNFDLEAAEELLKANLPKKELRFADTPLFCNGRFSAKHVDLKKYVSTWLFPEGSLSLGGYADLDGTFDPDSVSCTFDAQDVVLENEDLSIDIKELHRGFCHIDLEDNAVHGTLPVKNGIYFEKNNGLLFTDINATIELQDKKIHLPQIDGFCSGIYLAGLMDLDFTNPLPGAFSIEAHTHTMHGRFSQAQQFFSHFNEPVFFLNVPLEADFSLRKNGGYCRFDFAPDGNGFQAVIQGSLSEGRLKSENFDVALEGLSLDVDYDYQANKLNFSDIQGLLLVGKPENAEEYLIAGDHVRFTDYEKNESEFDVWVGDRNRDIIRLAGRTAAPANREGSDLVEFHFDQDLSHFGDVRLNTCELILREWSEVEICQLEFAFKLDTLFRDLQRFSHTGFLFLSPKLLAYLNDIQAVGGDCSFNLDFDKANSLLKYDLKASGLAVAGYKFNQFLLTGKRAHRSWVIDQMLLDDLSIGADIFYEDGECQINFLGLRLGSAVLAGMDGRLNKNGSALEGTINLLEVDLQRLQDWPAFRSVVEKLEPEGVLKGTGKLRIDFGKGVSDWRGEAELIASLKNIKLKGLAFKDAEGVSCQATSDRGVVFKQIKTALKSPDNKSFSALLDVEKVDYDTNSDTFYLEGMHFNVPAEKLSTLTRVLGSTFPEIFSPAILETCSKVKETGHLEGTLNVDVAAPHHAVRLALKDGRYMFHGQEHELNNFVLDLDPCEFKLLTQYRYQQHLFWMLVSSKSPKIDYGRMVLMDNHPDQQALLAAPPLVVYWRNYPETGMCVETAEGCFAGLQVSLYRNPEEPLSPDAMYLEGDVHAHVRQACCLLPQELAQKLSILGMGAGYTLQGNYMVARENNENRVFFQGALLGSDCELRGYQFVQLKADASLTPESVNLKNIRIDDPSGVLFSDRIDLQKNSKGEWACTSPKIRIVDFKPSVLREAEQYTATPVKPFVIRQVGLDNLSGIIGNESSFTGCGTLEFANPHKKNFQNPLLAIPAEILSRIGLDLTVLTPVVGTIFYELHDGKVVFTRFKDMYSEGRLSKFYLSQKPNHESSMDFEGNLSLHVRMKQYNLLFKIAELFTVKVNGTLLKPTYSLQKQQKTPTLKKTTS